MKNVLKLLVLLFFASCTSNYGNKLEYNKTEIYYTDKVTLEEVQKLGDYLIKSEFADGVTRSVQLTKDEQTGSYIFKMATKKSIANNELYIVLAKVIAKQFSDSIFNKTPVDYYFCDQKFNPIRKIPFEK
ncbi:hypothetical protein [Lutibacter sp.]